ncbi:MAG: CvpA family protein [Lactobacillales bacterium]|nr:CvpA family protein [Lactobacillales bacterium]
MILDIILVLIIFSSAHLGYKRGFTKELVSFLGFFVILVLSFIFKNPISMLMYENLPFFKFSWLVKGATSLNILLYEIISFLIVLSILMIIFRFLLFATSLIEKLLKMTFILGVPSKILGFIVGILEGIVWSFIIVYIINLPFFNVPFIRNSKISDTLLNNTPILTTLTKETVKASKEIENLIEEYGNKGTIEEFDYKTIDVMLEYKIVKVESIDKLVEKDKLKIKDIDKLLDKYKEA